MKTVGSLMTRGLELGAFFIQFLQWWHSEQTRTDITALPTPDPPPVEYLNFLFVVQKHPFCELKIYYSLHRLMSMPSDLAACVPFV